MRSLGRGSVLSVLPRRELTMIPSDTLDASYRPLDRPDADEG